MRPSANPLPSEWSLQQIHIPSIYSQGCQIGLKSHRMIESITERPGLQRTTVLIQFQPPAMCRVANQQPRLPRATSSLALNACRDGASTASLGNLFSASPPSGGKWCGTEGHSQWVQCRKGPPQPSVQPCSARGHHSPAVLPAPSPALQDGAAPPVGTLCSASPPPCKQLLPHTQPKSLLMISR